MTQAAHTLPSAGRGPELFFGLAGAVGADLELVQQALTSALAEVGYGTSEIRFSDAVHGFLRWKHLASVSAEDDRIAAHMRAGREIREKFARGDALALLALAKLNRVVRMSELGLQKNTPAQRRAYIFRSLKHPTEVATLRDLYGSAFFLVGAYSPKQLRVERLAQRIADSRGALRPSEYQSRAIDLVGIDEEETGADFGQNVRKVFPESDVFVNAAEGEGLRHSVRRFIELLFGHPYHTPSPDEFSMFHAYASALRSASMARQVGAVIADEDGELVSTGCNEVPKAGGGFYWPGDAGDGRDFQTGADISEQVKVKNLGQMLAMLAKNGWLEPSRAAEDEGTRLTNAKALLKKTQAMNPIEYVRAVHAEMAAIIGAARRGTSVRGCTLYTTTFPCHDCAKHIVGVGVRRVVYIEPYPKSLAEEMHRDSLKVEDTRCDGHLVAFQPFVGVAPRIYPRLFNAVPRKKDDGSIIDWSLSKTMALPRVPESLTELPYYFLRETQLLTNVLEPLSDKFADFLSTPAPA